MTRFGLLVPHFGSHADPDLLREGARQAEDLGFDSLWVRDHLVFRPHRMEDPDGTFVEPFITLSHLAGSTRSIGLGTATLIPFRHAIHTAQSVASLSWLTRRRIDLGIGAGNSQQEFEVVGLGDRDRPRLMREQMEIARRLWDGRRIDHHGDSYAFEDVQLKPTPFREVPIWWGGSTPAAARLAVDFCDGWLPGQINFPTFERRISTIKKMSMERGRDPVFLGSVPLISIGETRKEAAATFNLPSLLAHANGQRYWVRPKSGEFRSLGELDGWILAGTPEDVAAGIGRYQELGADLLVLDLRFRFGTWLEQVHLLARDILRLSQSAG